ncbi:hypothetical protein Plhal710r2_c002g0004941 [Plasmopara halstedii]
MHFPLILQAVRSIQVVEEMDLKDFVVGGTEYVIDIHQDEHDALSVQLIVEAWLCRAPLEITFEEPPVDLRVPLASRLPQAVEGFLHHVDMTLAFTRESFYLPNVLLDL